MRIAFRQILASSVMAMALAGVLMPLSFVNAASVAETCDCYCTSFFGATKPTDDKITSNECNTKCTEEEENVAAFACGANQHPSRTPFCFSLEECQAVDGEFDVEYQPPECTTGYKYCYPDPSKQEKVKLQVHIGEYTTSIDFGEYIGEMYKWMVYSAVIIAIVMLMIGGIRYSLGASSDQIAGAKKMMTNALTGLVLLLTAYLILFTVNPDLVSLQVPRLPMIKQIALVDNADCTELREEGWDIEFDGPEECGTVGTVKADDEGNAVPDGTMCNFMSCPDGGLNSYCVPGDEPKCMRCEELGVSNDAGIMPTSNLCSKFNSLRGYAHPYYKENIVEEVDVEYVYTGPGAPPGGRTGTYKEKQVKSYKSCQFSRDPDVGGDMISAGACVLIDFDCSAITSCGDYDNIQIQFGGASIDLDEIDVGKNPGLSGTGSGVFKLFYDSAGDFTLNTFCTSGSLGNMCEWNISGNSSCQIGNTSLVPYGGANALAPGSYDCQTY